jgi:adenylate cyclase
VAATLKIKDPTGNSWEIKLSPGSAYAIGRAKENDIVLNDRRVSRKHAHLSPSGTGFRIVDGYFENGNLVRSVNHVFVNGAAQFEKELTEGDVITIGESRLEFTTSERPVEPAGNASVLASMNVSSVLQELESNKTDLKAPPPAASVSYDDTPLGHTQLEISANEIIGRQSHLSIEAPAATPEEIKDLRRKAKILDLMFEMSKMLGTVFDLKEIFEKATDLIFRGTPADRVVALLADDNANGRSPDQGLKQIAVKTRDANLGHLSDKLTISRTITEKVMQERVAILSQDARSDAQFHGAESIVSQGVRATICAPLITESKVHGVVYVDRLDPFAAFSPDHLDLITAVAAQTAVTVETIKAHDRLAREEVARANYSRFMPEYVVKQLLDNPNSFRLGGANQTVTVLFADIRGFTSIAEKAKPEVIVTLLNRFFSAMSEIIFANGGTLDKYIGDGLMAIFGAPTATPDDARNAVDAAIQMQNRVVKLNAELRSEGLPEISMGVGLATGEATIGYIGSDRRSEYTAIGDTVNLASRLESNAGGGQIFISEATALASQSTLPLRVQPPLMVKNRQQPVNLYELKWH